MVPRESFLLLTGTSFHNSTDELWDLLKFSNSDPFESKGALVENFGQLTNAKQESDLKIFLRPYIILIVKEDVDKSLTPK